MEFSVNDFFGKCKMWTNPVYFSYLPKKSFTESFIFCAVLHFVSILTWQSGLRYATTIPKWPPPEQKSTIVSRAFAILDICVVIFSICCLFLIDLCLFKSPNENDKNRSFTRNIHTNQHISIVARFYISLRRKLSKPYTNSIFLLFFSVLHSEHNTFYESQ